MTGELARRRLCITMERPEPPQFAPKNLNHRQRRMTSKSGLTLLEVMVSILVMSVAVYILTSTVAASVSHSSAKAERSLAVEAAMNVLETIRSMPQEDVFRMFNTPGADDPYGAGTGSGPFFNVAGLDPQVDAGGRTISVGQVLVPENAAGQLDESANLPQFGFPRDLNGNLGIDVGNRVQDYLVLPITIRIQWQGHMGPRSFELSTMLVDLAKWQD